MTVEHAERMARSRSLIAITLGTLLMVTQGTRMDGGAGPASWILTGIVVAAFVVWASGLFRGARFRGFINDEASDLNRRRALAIGFGNMLAAALVCYCLTYVKEYGARDAIQIIMTVGISSALISFGAAELIGMRR